MSTSSVARVGEAALAGSGGDPREERRELEQERERDEDADRRDAAAVEHRVREAGGSERGGDGDEEQHGAALGEPAVDEPVRCVVAAPLGYRLARAQPQRRHEGRVEDRDREHEHGQRNRRDRRPCLLVGRHQPERREHEADQLAAGVAHEDPRRARETEVVRQEAEQCEDEGRRDDEDVPVRVDEGGGERKAGCRHDAEAAREPVHVVEQVERVREADEPEHPDRPGKRLVRDEFDGDRAVQDEVRGDELGAQLRRRMQMDDVVEEAEREDDRAGAHHREHLLRDPDGPDAGGGEHGECEAREDADAAEGRRRARMPAVRPRIGAEGLQCPWPAQQPGDDGEGDRGRDDGEEDVHGPGMADAGGIDRRSLTRRVGGHGARQHPPYNPAVSVYGDLIRYRELFASLFQRDLRAKYKGSALGLLWTLALPVTLMLVYLVVFSVMWKSPTTDVDHYWLFLLCGLPPWVFFATSLQSSARSLLENASLIRKVRFPRQLVPLSIVATQLVAFAVMTAIVLVLAMIVLPDSRSTAWLAIPIGAVIVLFVSGLSLAVASANAIYRDIEFVVAALLAAAVLPHARALQPRQPARGRHASVADRPDPVGQPADAARRVLPGAALPRRGAPDRRPRLSASSRRSSRSCSARSSSPLSTTGSPRKCDGEPAVEEPAVARVGREAEMLRRLDPVEQRGQQQRLVEARVAAAAAAPRGELARPRPRATTAVPTAAQPSACASRSRRDQAGGGAAPATR